MSDEGEKTCPLCAEEMDMTDQQLKPCRCGYEICVWCWHHIMDMAEKDDTDGRCPACRTPYDKDRIVGTAANCERMVAEINLEKKHKSQKAKSKTSESWKQLSTVRVIQKNLVYIVGLPLNLADEDILQHKEYFSQYGKVLKVSISRTSSGTIQQFPNNTCSVYITYAKEEEAVRCIQSVHGFILDGRPLRACFGTTKYCHAWLRNMPCSNPDYLYLHEIGSQEDSFTKDEIISAYTRSIVQQITGHTNNTHRCTGNVLPPPTDDYCNSNAPVVAIPVVKSTLNNSTSCARGSPPTSSSGRSGALPPAASWGACASNASNPPTGALASSNGPMKQKSEIVGGSQPLSTTVSSISHYKLSSSDGGKKLMRNEETHSRQTAKSKDMCDTSKHHNGQNTQTIATEVPPTSSGVSAVKPVTQSPNLSAASNNDGNGHMQHNSTVSVDGRPCSPVRDERERERDGVEPIPIPTLGIPLTPFDFFVSLKNNKLVLTDMRGNIVYYSTHFKNINMAAAAVLYDSSSTPLFSILPLPVGSWKGFKADSEQQLMFSVNRTLNRLNKVKFNINTGDKLNMSMRGCVFWRSCTIYHHNTIIAQTNLMYKLGFRKLFVSRVKMDLALALRYRKKPIAIGVLGIIIPYGLGSLVAFLLQRFISLDRDVLAILPFVVEVESMSAFLVVTCSLTRR